MRASGISCAVIPKVLLVSFLGSFLRGNYCLFGKKIIPIKNTKVLGSSRLKNTIKLFHLKIKLTESKNYYRKNLVIHSSLQLINYWLCYLSTHAAINRLSIGQTL